jgi:hypothetical protein
MAKIRIAIIVLIVFLAGCAASQKYQIGTVKNPYAQKIGLVSIDIENPSLFEQEVWIFEGSTLVEMVPNNHNGWMFSRPAIMFFTIDSANSENNWHEYLTIFLPRNTSFVLASRTKNIWGMGWPEFYHFRTGPNPGYYQYVRVVPSQPRVSCAGLVTLRERVSQQFGDSPLKLEWTIDSRDIADWIIRNKN